ncbi:MAG: cyclic nucleotide-binding domain-containing protein [Pseudomonadota bacterium]
MSAAFAPLPAPVRAALEAVATTKTLPGGAFLVREGEPPSAFFAIVDGTASVERCGADGTVHRLAEVGAGELVGEMAFMDGEPRSASVRAMGPVTVTTYATDQLGEEAVTAVKAALGAAMVARLRGQNERQIAALEREVDNLKERRAFGLFYIFSVAVLAGAMLVDSIVSRQILAIDPYSVRFSWQYILGLTIPMVAVAWALRIAPRALGVTTQNLRRSLIEGVAISALIVALIFLVVVPLLDDFGVTRTPFVFGAGGLTLYVLHCFLQELFARGFMQGAFQRFLDDKRGVLSVCLSSLMFGISHMHYGLFSVGVTLVGGLIFGAIYLRHQNLAGVTLVHIVLGVAAFRAGLL